MINNNGRRLISALSWVRDTSFPHRHLGTWCIRSALYSTKLIPRLPKIRGPNAIDRQQTLAVDQVGRPSFLLAGPVEGEAYVKTVLRGGSSRHHRLTRRSDTVRGEACQLHEHLLGVCALEALRRFALR